MKSLLLAAVVAVFSCLTACEQQPYQMGERLYKTHCANCHMDSGEGLAALIPPLAGSDYLTKHRGELACLIRYGLNDTIVVNGKTFSGEMLGNDKLSEIQITNVLNYICQSWGNKAVPFQFEEVKASLEGCKR